MRRDGHPRPMLGIVIALACAGIAAAPPIGAEEVVGVVHGELSNQHICETIVEFPDGNYLLDPFHELLAVTIETDATPQQGGETIALTNTTLTVRFGDFLIQQGVDAGLLNGGERLPASMDLTMQGTNTAEAAQTVTGVGQFRVEVEDDVAQPMYATFVLPNTSWDVLEPDEQVAFHQGSMTLTATLPLLVEEGLLVTSVCVPTGNPLVLTIEYSMRPAMPTGLRVETGDGQVLIGWDAPESGAPITKYHVSIVDSTGNPPIGIGATTRAVPGDQTSMVFTGLTNGRGYRFRVAAENAFGVGPRSDPSILVTPVPLVSIGDATTFEGNAGGRGLRFTVSLSALSVKTVTVKYKTTSGTAKSTSDFTAKSGTATIPAGKASTEVAISVRGDLSGEATEWFGVVLGLTGNARLGRSVASGKIVNDDPGPLARRVHIGDASVDEGRTGSRSVRLTVSLSAVSTKKTTVKYATANWSAVNTSDYTKTSGTITIPAGRVSAMIAVSVRGDTKKESNEAFKVTLSTPTGASLGRSSAIATIYNDD